MKDFKVGDKVRFNWFGLWVDGRVSEIRDGLLGIQNDAGGIDWRNPDVDSVVAARWYGDPDD